MGRMRIRYYALAAVLAVAVIALTTCSNPIDLVQAATVEVMKANDRYLEVVSTTPVAGATTVNPGSRIRLILDRDVDIDSVNGSTISVVGSISGTATWTATFDPVTKTLSIKPTTILDGPAEYTVAVSGIRGSDGSTLLEDVAWQFNTITAPSGQVVVTSTNGESLAGYTNIPSVNVTIINPNGLADEFTVASSEAALDDPEANGASWDWEGIGGTIAHTIPAIQGLQYTFAMIKDLSPEQFSGVLDTGIIYDTVAPNAPTLSGTTPTTDRTPTWSWASGGGGGNGTFRYQLDSTAGAWTTTTAVSYTPAGDLALGNHTLYVQERDNAGNWSTNGSRVIGIAPLAPTSVSATDSTSTAQVTVSWIAPSGTILNYYVDRSTSATGTYTQIGSAAASPYNDTTAVAGTIYYYKVRAEGTNNYISAASGPDSGSKKLTAPTGLIATLNTSTAQVTISWTALSGSTRYYVSRATASGGPYTDLSSYSTGTSYNDTTGTPGTIYYYKVRSWATYDGETTSGYATGIRKITAPIVTATDGTESTGITISWTAPSGATGYRVYRSTNASSGYGLVTTIASSPYSDTGVTSTNTTYYYKVEAYGSAGTGYPSDLSSYEAGHRGLTYITGLTARTYMTGNYIQLSWTALSGATGYMIYQYNSTTYTWDYYTSTTGTIVYLAPNSYNTDMHYRIRAYDTSTSYPGVMTPSYVTARRLGLNGYWPFNNSWVDTGLADSSTDSFSVTSGSPSFSTTRKLGTYSAYFSSYSQKITNSDYTFMSSDRKKVSVSYWVYPTKLSTGLMWAMACGDFNVGFSGTEVTMTISLPLTNSASATLTLNTWNHIVGTYDGSNIRIYKNGALVETTAHAGTVPGYTTALNVYSGTSANYWTGYLDDLRIYDVTLSASQVADLYIFD